MLISIEEVDRIARLSRLRFSDTEKQKLAIELSQIVAYIDKLNELDLTEVPPMSQVIELGNRMRDDEAVPWFSPEQALQNAPARQGNFFSVPKVIKKD
ncbi:MAG: Asp-tRNA(Asn)/Glu-tRNA(Gln) amidotransferase subunit GatC [candidate division KSB1 bacterium]|nr:Asp-tRNA(Asn)/Glu-tRNA(Gln) amidotransferase subunit GatC [candidate division KSB1 bacterium]MDZ7334856.1 Asp-tRNA(Asn)/Glu-tRNA(Gln) amidotransferase subunit GatC [candidate division KSB1 bacterium]MDZ7357863.1 Asp-tRNA(Asn)/Glu-tRNA(Gln) amidotransferase subunit GatC [candidate division KSB1 bacterium]MDZ7375280.1 Asp-tRNA(Asn)/Glu-tRNA(Gln) amidotransferase subunit GatC [candidate division KSB1 bacterium]MDZ7400415.1 Asp-tRNA(Asn)/Glu-tRNA(Gln) amidotransferase subunit GatC [candidate div